MSAVHLHVGSNIPGCLPQTAPKCFGDLRSALDALRAELVFVQGDFYECCDGGCGLDGNGDPCAWCDVAGDVQAALSDLVDGDAASHLDRDGQVGWTFRPPEGADLHYWCARLGTAPGTCELDDALIA